MPPSFFSIFGRTKIVLKMDKNAENPFIYDGFDKLSYQNRTKVKNEFFLIYRLYFGKLSLP